MTNENIKQLIADGQAVLGVELGSTRIKAVLIGQDHQVIAQGGYSWENQLENGIWTYAMEDVWTGLRGAYADLAANAEKTYGETLTNLKAIGISGMMHGYLVFNKEEKLLAPFRTLRNTITEEAAAKLTELFNYNIPQRWSAAHLYQAILNGESHVKEIAFQTTLAGYIHWQLTGEKVMGVGEASGMFPIDPSTHDFDREMVAKFDVLTKEAGMPWTFDEIYPKVLVAGEEAGRLTVAGAMLLDPCGNLHAGILFCPPEGDAGTGMVATNSVKVRTGNISAGTSIFGMVVLEKNLKAVHRELDLVTTPAGDLVAMAHCNNCTTDLNAWVSIFDEFAKAAGFTMTADELYGTLYNKALEGDADCGGVMAYNYYSGEGITDFDEGRPLLVRMPDAKFNLANLMRANLYSAAATLKLGMDILTQEEEVKIDVLLGHGGLFKTKGVAQQFMAAAMQAPVTVMENAGEGGAWGIALLAAYMVNAQGRSLDAYLEECVFGEVAGTAIAPNEVDLAGFNAFAKSYVAGLPIERAAVNCLR